MGYRIILTGISLISLLGCSAKIRPSLSQLSSLPSSEPSPQPLTYAGVNQVQLNSHSVISKPSLSEGNQWRKIAISDSGRVFTLSEILNLNDYSWSIIPSMNSSFPYGNYGTTFIRLNTGKFLLVGNGEWNTAPINTELFNAETVTWESAGNLNLGRNYPNANLLPDGRVLVTSGNNSSGGPVGSAEIYDPVTNAWTLKASNLIPRKEGATALLDDGNLLLCGGQTAGGATDTCELYDPSTNTWTSTGSMNFPRALHDMVKLDDGRVLLIGGDNPVSPNSSEKTEIYDPTLGTWAYTGSFATTRTYLGYVLLRDGRVLVAGGYNWAVGSNERLDTIEIYDPNSNTWSLSSAKLSNKRTDKPALIELPDGKILFVGGYDGISDYTVDLGSHFTEEFTLTATGGSGSYTYSLLSGPGRVSGNKYYVGVPGRAQIQVSDGMTTQTVEITVLAPECSPLLRACL